MAFVTYLVLSHVNNKPTVEIGLLTWVVLATALLAQWIQTSVALAIVVLGLFMTARGSYAVTPDLWHFQRFWVRHIAHFCNTLLFFVSGVIVYDNLLSNVVIMDEPKQWALLLLNVFMQHLIRLFTILLFVPAIQRWSDVRLDAKEIALLTFSGLRGAVALALMLLADGQTDIPLRTRQLLSFHVSGIVCFTLLINGSCTARFYSMLRMQRPTPYHMAVLQRVTRLLEHRPMKMLLADIKRGTEWQLTCVLYGINRSACLCRLSLRQM
jgi:NhaP-type Na+/H+ or K+/H+ antiporter